MWPVTERAAELRHPQLQAVSLDHRLLDHRPLDRRVSHRTGQPEGRDRCGRAALAQGPARRDVSGDRPAVLGRRDVGPLGGPVGRLHGADPFTPVAHRGYPCPD